MALLTVTAIIDGATFVVDPGWEFHGEEGRRVQPLGYEAPGRGDDGYEEATKRLADLILDREVELGDAHCVQEGRLVCRVFIQGVDLATHSHRTAVSPRQDLDMQTEG